MNVHTMMEEREELMVAPGRGTPTLRSAHFLKPTDSPTSQNQYTPFPLSSNTIFKGKTLNALYSGWKMIRKCTQEGWEKWVRKLQPLYGETWKKAGIFDAILASTYSIMRRKSSKNLMSKLAEKWRPETNTFLFPWGECTVTLEDIMVLGGLPVLGQPVGSPLISDEILRVEKNLRDAQTYIWHDTLQAPRGSTWLDHFIAGGGEDLEHEAFLVLWLSRYIFPSTYGLIARDLFLIAVNLSRGIPVALAPAVLASIYRDLGSLKKASSMGCNNVDLSLCSPLGLVQVWVWERFPKLSPTPNKPVALEEQRLSRWHGVNPFNLEAAVISEVLDSSGGDFQWRPYVGMLKKFYKENDGYVMAGPDMDSEVIQVLVRYWRNSELVGMDCVEQYLPHRVGMQFGFDQDVPGPVERMGGHCANCAWRHFNRPVGDAKLYIPARLFKPDITKTYREAWNRALGKQEMGDDTDTCAPLKETEAPACGVDSVQNETMEIPGGVNDQSRPTEMEIPIDTDISAPLQVSGNEEMEIPNEQSRPVEMEIPDVETDKSAPLQVSGSEEMEILDEQPRPVEMEIPDVVEDQFGPENVEKSKFSVEHGHGTVNCRSSKRCSSSYSIEEVQAMVTNLEKLWATFKAKKRESVAKKMKARI